MQSPKLRAHSFTHMIMKFVIILSVAVVWCGLSIPVQGVADDETEEKNIDGMEKCLKASKEVQKDGTNVEKVKEFLSLCEKFIDKMDLTESQVKILEQVGYKRNKKARDKIKENATGDKEVTDKDKTKNTSTSDKGVPPEEKDKAKDSSISDKQDADTPVKQKPHPAKASDAGMHDNVAQETEYIKGKKEDIKAQDLKLKTEKHPKQSTSEQAQHSKGKEETQGTGSEQKEEKKLEHKPVTKFDSQHTDSKDKQKQTIQSEQVQSENLHEETPILHFTTILSSLGMKPEDVSKTFKEIKEIRKKIKMQHQQKPEVQTHVNFPDSSSPQFAFHEQFRQDGQQFDQEIPQFGRQYGQDEEFGQQYAQDRFQFRQQQYDQDRFQFRQQPFDQDRPQFRQHFDQNRPQFRQEFGEDISNFRQSGKNTPVFHDWKDQFHDPVPDAGFLHPDQRGGPFKPTFKQDILPFPEQAQFPAHFQDQELHQFDQGKLQMPQAPPEKEYFTDKKFSHDPPKPNTDRGARRPTYEEPSTKHKVDEL